MRNWKYAFIPYFTKSADEAIDILKRAGYDGVEWNLQLHFETPDKLKPLAMKTRTRFGNPKHYGLTGSCDP